MVDVLNWIDAHQTQSVIIAMFIIMAIHEARKQ